MKVLILGFTDYNELDAAMNKLIEESQTYLFNIICGGVQFSENKTIAEQWAENNGCPIVRLYNSDFDKLIYQLRKECDYLVIRISDETPQWQKNLMMQLKSDGKHGTVIR